MCRRPSYPNPLVEEILVETLRTLVVDYGLSYQEIDKTRVLGVPTGDIYKFAHTRWDAN
jgi:hypothetical protein